ncbi:Mob protein [Xinfangfangia sp. CPCC 101601]|uniref:Mob protein n=1 Tax=Pseudogemmobacter lacusdianii TaxID=3069608 RepID=A0ABU0VU20_9RHOB|nr:Mob protein [Xinfangfangia sp. CPCC 101601]MDQ2065221.1 Mob protein [Xinfangfangia sp. CPCC 101601]
MAYQFFHIETYSQAPKKVRGAADHFNTAEQVEEEARRTPAYSEHVASPRPYLQLPFCTPINEFIEKRRAKVATLVESVKAKGGGTYTRGLRSDAATLYTEVHSHPIASAVYLADTAAYGDEVSIWTMRVMQDFSARMPEGVVHTAVMHSDEGHLHIHILAYNDADPKMDANKLHVGKRAAAEYRQTHQTDVIESLEKPELDPLPLKPKKPKPSKNRTTQAKNDARHAEAVAAWEEARAKVQAENDARMEDWKKRNQAHLKAGRLERGGAADQKVYKAAMQRAQDAYHEAVGLPCGLLRHGPRQERLSTKTYAARKREAKHAAQVVQRLENEAEKLMEEDEALSATRQGIIEAASEREAELDAREFALDAKEAALGRRAAELDARESDLTNAIGAMSEIMDAVEQSAIKGDGQITLGSNLPYLSRFRRMLAGQEEKTEGVRLLGRFFKMIQKLTVGRGASAAAKPEPPTYH